MGITAVHRVQCDLCTGWLRNGRVTPIHWGPMYAQVFDTAPDAEWAAIKAGWDGITGKIRCPRCQKKNAQ